MTKADYITGIASIVDSFPTLPSDTLTGEQETALTDLIAAYCETTNPTNDYPPTKK